MDVDFKTKKSRAAAIAYLQELVTTENELMARAVPLEKRAQLIQPWYRIKPSEQSWLLFTLTNCVEYQSIRKDLDRATKSCHTKRLERMELVETFRDEGGLRWLIRPTEKGRSFLGSEA